MHRYTTPAAILALALLAGLLGAAPVAQAQDEPPQAVMIALQALSAQVGAPLRLGDLTSWQWAQKNFPDRSLGCPQPGYAYPQFVTNGYSVTLVYNGVIYDYRMTANFQTVFECTSFSGAPGGTPLSADTPTPLPTPVLLAPAPTVTPAPTAPPPLVGAPACAGGLPVRLAGGMQGRSIASGSINIRSAPDLNDPNAVIGLLLPGAGFEVLGGPQCAQERTWWQIRAQTAGGTVTGWVIEGDNVEYWLEPVTAVTGQAPITAGNAAQLRQIAMGALGPGVRAVRFVPPQHGEVLLIDGSGALRLYSGVTVDPAPLMLGHAGQAALAIAAGPRVGASFRAATLEQNPAQSRSALFYLWEVSVSQGAGAPTTAREVLGVPLPALPNAIAFSPDGRLIAISSGDLAPAPEGALPAPAIVWLWDALSGAQLAPALVPGPAADLAFSPDGLALAICVPGSGVALWDTVQAVERALIPAQCGRGGTPSLAFSPAGTVLAIGTQEGRVILWDVGQGLALRDLAIGAAPVTQLAFSADGALLAAASGPDASVWAVLSGERLADLSAALSEAVSGLAFRYGGTQVIVTGAQNWWAFGAP